MWQDWGSDDRRGTQEAARVTQGRGWRLEGIPFGGEKGSLARTIEWPFWTFKKPQRFLTSELLRNCLFPTKGKVMSGSNIFPYNWHVSWREVGMHVCVCNGGRETHHFPELGAPITVLPTTVCYPDFYLAIPALVRDFHPQLQEYLSISAGSLSPSLCYLPSHIQDMQREALSVQKKVQKTSSHKSLQSKDAYLKICEGTPPIFSF